MTLSWARRSQNKQTAQIPCKVERDGQMYFGDAELHWKRREKEKTNNPQTVKATKHSDRIQRDSSRCCLFFICNLGISGWFQRMSGTTTRQSSLAMDAGSRPRGEESQSSGRLPGGCEVLSPYRLDGEGEPRCFAQEMGEGADPTPQYALETDFWESRAQFF